MNQDEEHLRLLSIFHYIVGGLSALGGCFPVIHLVVGVAIASGALGPEGPPTFFGWFFAGLAAFGILVGWSLAVVIALAGRFLARRTHYTFCFMVAAVECVFVPIGTVLGVFTIIVLNRTSVRALFEVETPTTGG